MNGRLQTPKGGGRILSSLFEAPGVSNRSLAMEGLRGVAILLVFCCHYYLVVCRRIGLPVSSPLGITVIQLGGAGVDLFFLLSGILIYGAAIRPNLRLRQFWRRRIQRIYPTFLVVFAIYVAVSYFGHTATEKRIPSDHKQALLYLSQNLLLLPGLFNIEALISAAWSLSYEFFFYLTLPLLIRCLALNYWTSKSRIALFLSFLGLHFILAINLVHPSKLAGPHDGTYIRMGMFVAGMVFVELNSELRWLGAMSKTRLAAISVVGMVSFAPFALFELGLCFGSATSYPRHSLVRFCLVFCSFLCLSVLVLPFNSPLNTLMSVRGLRWIGNMSFSFYLIHGLVLNFLAIVIVRLTHSAGKAETIAIACFLPSLAITLVVSAALYLLVERPFSLVKKPKALRLAPETGPSVRLGAVFQSAAARFLVVGVNATTGILTARSLRPQGRGELAALLLWPQVLSGVVALGLPNALTFYISKKPEQSRAYLLAGAQLGAVCSVLATVIGLLFMPALLREYPPYIAFWAKLLLPTLSFSIFAAFGRAVLEAKGRFRESNLNLAGFSFSALAGLLLLVAVNRLGTVSAGIVYACSGLPGLVFLIVKARRHFRWAAFQAEQAFELLSYGLRSYGGDLCGVLTLYVDQALVITMLSPSKMGAYVVALNLSRIVNVVQQSICIVLFPRSVGLAPNAVMMLNRRAMHVSLMISVVCGGAVALTGPTLLRVLYGGEYLQASSVFRIFLLEVVINGVVAVAAQAFLALNRPGIVTIQQAAGLLLALPLLMLLIPRFGLTGAGVAILIATSARMVVILASFPLVLKVPVPSLVPSRADWAWMGDALRRKVRSRMEKRAA
jgi:peptidoglycan/LPS O-acetylase OafA/YrhL/O-antigen/teichoic acid export membrane protein